MNAHAALFCPPSIEVEINTISGYYSQAAGAMAGLSFTALVLLLGAREQDPHAPRRAPDALMALFVTLFALIAAMINYSVLAGQPEVDGRTVGQELVAGLGFALAIEMLFYALVLLLEARREYAAIAGAARWVTVLVAPMIGLLFLVIGARDTEYLRARPDAWGVPTVCDDSMVVPVTGLSLVVVVSVLLAVVRFADWRIAWVQQHRRLASTGALASNAIVLVLFVALALQPPEFIPPRAVVIAFLVVAAVLLATISVLIQTGSRDAENDPPADGDEGADYGLAGVRTRRYRWGIFMVKRGHHPSDPTA